MQQKDICIGCSNGWDICCETEREDFNFRKSSTQNLDERGLCISCYGWTACCGKSDSEMNIKKTLENEEIESTKALKSTELNKNYHIASKKVNEKTIWTCFDNGLCLCGDFYTSSVCSAGFGCYGYNGQFYCNQSYWSSMCCY